MRLIDLHVHSNVSDGTCTPAEVVRLAKKINLAAFALTDHDTVNGINDAILEAENLRTIDNVPLEVIPGIEISASYEGKDVHILGLYINHTDTNLLHTLTILQDERENRNIKMADNLAKAGIDINIEKLREEEGDAVITRAHFAKYLVKHNYTKSTKDAFTKYLGSDGPYYVPRKYLTTEQAIQLIKSAGGIAVLAHPLLYKLSDEKLDKLVAWVKKSGIQGIETFYSCNMGNDESKVRKLARKHNLIMTGGSDFHGSVKPNIALGSGMNNNLKIPETILSELKELLL